MNTEQENMQRYEEDMVEIDLREYITLLWRKKWIIIVLLVVAVLASYFFSKSMTKIYQTSTVVMVKEDSGMDSLFGDQFSMMSGKASKISTYTAMMKTRVIMNKVITELDLRNEEGELLSNTGLANHISISGSTDTNMMTITVEYSDPVVARDIANKLVEVFKEQNQQINRADLKSATSFISNQLETVKVNLAELEDKLLAYKMENGVVLPEEYGKKLLEQLTELETNRAEARLNIEETQLALVETRKQFNQEDREIISGKTITNNPVVLRNSEKLVNLEIELAGLLEVYTEKHPKVIEIKRQIEEVKGVLSTAVEEIISSRTETLNPLYQTLKQKIISLETTLITAGAKVNGLEQRISELELELNKLPTKELDLARLQRESKVAENIYLILMERREEIRIQEAMQSSDIVVVDPAIAKKDQGPIKPNTKLNVVIAAFLAVFIGVFIIFLIEYLDNSVKEEEDVERLTGLTVISVIPDMNMVDHDQGYGVDSNV